jgi:hypothetical protein
MLGYEIGAIPKPPRWAKPTDAPLDEEIPGPWMYHVLQMSNHGSMRLKYQSDDLGRRSRGERCMSRSFDLASMCSSAADAAAPKSLS